MSASKDWNLIVWTMSSLNDQYIIPFEMPLSSSVFVPHNNSKIICLPAFGSPKIITIDIPNRKHTMSDLLFQDEDYHMFVSFSKSNDLSDSEAQYTCLEFDHKSTLMFLGNSKGSVFVVDSSNDSIVLSVKVSLLKSPIRQIDAHKDGK